MGEISGFLKGNGDDHICILERFYKGSERSQSEQNWLIDNKNVCSVKI